MAIPIATQIGSFLLGEATDMRAFSLNRPAQPTCSAPVPASNTNALAIRAPQLSCNTSSPHSHAARGGGVLPRAGHLRGRGPALCKQNRAFMAAAGEQGAAAADYSEFEAFAHELADTAAAVTTPYFRSKLIIDNKADESPVTRADREAEAAMREKLSAKFPGHGVFGEEEGMGGAADSPFLWVLDPIDGTKSFITGKPVYGTLIALLHDGVPVLGVIDQPITKERWIGVAGKPTTLNGEAIETRKCGAIGEAYLYATSPHMFAGATESAWARVRDAARLPLYGCDCYAYGLLAAGFVDLVVEADMKPYDFLAMVPIIEGAGGRITNWRGESIQWTATPSHTYALDALAGEVLAAGDPAVHAEAVRLLAWDEPL